MASQAPLDFDNYRAYEGQANPTTQAQLQNYMANQNDLLIEILQTLVWLPSRVYALNNVVYCGGGLWAKCTTAGTSGTTEPQWNTGTISDGGCVWSVSDGSTALSSHIANTNNPHSVTKAQVGLGSVVNTGDSATPVSGGTTKFTTGGAYTELAKKLDIAQSSENVGKVPKVNASGNLELADITITGYVAIAQGAANSNKKLVTDSSGNVVTQKIYPDWMTDRGDCSDGAFAPTSNTTIAGGVKNYTSVNIPAGVTVTCTDSTCIKCQGAFVNNGTIKSEGGVGSRCYAGVAATKYAGNGCRSGDDEGDYSLAGKGHGLGGAGGGSGGGAIELPYVADYYNLLMISGGGGGGSSAAYRDYSGGGGGGAIVIIASTITNYGTISVKGGNGINYTSSRGGSGGGGGAIGLIANTVAQGTCVVTGGTGYQNGANGTLFVKELVQ